MRIFILPTGLTKSAKRHGNLFALGANLITLDRNFPKAFFAEPEVIFLAAEAGYWEKRIKDNFFDFSNHFLNFSVIFEFREGVTHKLYTISRLCFKAGLCCFSRYGNINLLEKYQRIQK